MIVNYPVPLVATTLGAIIVFAIAWRALSWYELEEQRLYDEQVKSEEPKFRHPTDEELIELLMHKPGLGFTREQAELYLQGRLP